MEIKETTDEHDVISSRVHHRKTAKYDKWRRCNVSDSGFDGGLSTRPPCMFLIECDCGKIIVKGVFKRTSGFGSSSSSFSAVYHTSSDDLRVSRTILKFFLLT